MLTSIEKLIDSYYSKGGAKEVKILSETYLNITKKDHIRTTFTHNAFHVNQAAVRP